MDVAHSSTAPATQSKGADMWRRMEHTYDAALATGALSRTEGSDHFTADRGIEFIVRVAASLRRKAKKK